MDLNRDLPLGTRINCWRKGRKFELKGNVYSHLTKLSISPEMLGICPTSPSWGATDMDLVYSIRDACRWIVLGPPGLCQGRIMWGHMAEWETELSRAKWQPETSNKEALQGGLCRLDRVFQNSPHKRNPPTTKTLFLKTVLQYPGILTTSRMYQPKF